MGTIFIVCICFGLPGCVFYYVQRKQRVGISFVVGVLVFFISQIVLRIPLLNFLSQQVGFQVWMLNGIAYSVFLAFTAGLFEEVGRWVGFHCLKRKITLYDAITLGLGHGALEAVLFLGLPVLQMGNVALYDVLAGGVERISAMLLHIALTMLVYKAISYKKIRYLGYAIMTHTMFNFMSVMLMQAGVSIAIIELLLFIFACGILGIVYMSIVKKERDLK